MIARFEECSLDEIRDDAKLLIFGLNSGHTEWDDAIEKSIMDKARRLQCVSTIKVVPDLELPIVNSMVELPCDYLSLIALRLNKNDSGYDPSLYLPLQYVTSNNRPYVSVYNLDWIQDGYLKMPSNVQSDTVFLTYDATNTKNGFPVLYERYREGLSRFAASRYFAIKGDLNTATYWKRQAQAAFNSINAQDLIDKWNEQKVYDRLNSIGRWLF